MNIEQIQKDIAERLSVYTDSRQPTDDEVTIAWLLCKLKDRELAAQLCLSGSVAAKECGTVQELNKGHYHEIMDRSYLISSLIDDFLINHPGMTDKMNSLCEEAQQSLCEMRDFACGEYRNFGG